MSTHSHLSKIHLLLPPSTDKKCPFSSTHTKHTSTHPPTSHRKCPTTATHSIYTSTHLQQPVQNINPPQQLKIYPQLPQPTHKKCFPTPTYPKYTSTYHHLTLTTYKNRLHVRKTFCNKIANSNNLIHEEHF